MGLVLTMKTHASMPVLPMPTMIGATIVLLPPCSSPEPDKDLQPILHQDLCNRPNLETLKPLTQIT